MILVTGATGQMGHAAHITGMDPAAGQPPHAPDVGRPAMMSECRACGRSSRAANGVACLVAASTMALESFDASILDIERDLLRFAVRDNNHLVDDPSIYLFQGCADGLSLLMFFSNGGCA